MLIVLFLLAVGALMTRHVYRDGTALPLLVMGVVVFTAVYVYDLAR